MNETTQSIVVLPHPTLSVSSLMELKAVAATHPQLKYDTFSWLTDMPTCPRDYRSLTDAEAQSICEVFSPWWTYAYARGTITLAPRSIEAVVPPSNDPDPVVGRVITKLRERSRRGVAEYGHDLTRDDYTLKDFLLELQTELLDGSNYAEAALHKLGAQEAILRDLIDLVASEGGSRRMMGLRDRAIAAITNTLT